MTMFDDDEELAEEEMAKLETEFRKAMELAKEEMKEHLKLAEEHLKAAEKIADSHGVAFDSRVSRIRQTYWGKNMTKKFPGINNRVLEEHGFYSEYNVFDYGGWEHSAVCN